MTGEDNMLLWRNRFSKARSRLMFAMGSVLSSPPTTESSTMLADAVNEIFDVLDDLHSLQNQRFEVFGAQMQRKLVSGNLQEPGEDQNGGAVNANTEIGDKTEKERITRVEKKDIGARFCRYKGQSVVKPQEGEETISDDITQGALPPILDDDMQAPLRNIPKTPSSLGGKSAREIEVGEASTPARTKKAAVLKKSAPLKKRDENPAAKEDVETENQDSKRQKKVPCNQCRIAKRNSLTDSDGYLDQTALGKWLKKGVCLKAVHFPREVTLPRPKPLGVDMYDLTLPETETQPPME